MAILHWSCGHCLFTKDLIFGLCIQVRNDEGWTLLSELPIETFRELANALRSCQHNFPWQKELQELVEEREAAQVPH